MQQIQELVARNAYNAGKSDESKGIEVVCAGFGFSKPDTVNSSS